MNDYQIMLVDDDPGILALSSRVLEKIGYRKPVTFSSGQLALEHLETNQVTIDIIMCDLNMPEMNGVEFLRHISDIDYNGGIILASGEDERILETAKDLAKARKLNVLGYISKPLKKEALKLLLLKYSQQDIKISNPFEDAINEEELRSGIDGDELVMAYQPKVNLVTDQIEGVEALARWNHPARGLLSPNAFIPLAEHCNLIHELTISAYRKSLSHLKILMESGYSLKMSTNISVNSFVKEGFADFLIKTAEEYNIDPSLIILEITESEIMENSLDCHEVLMHLRMKNFGLSIDDFGTGHSSMAQLKSIPFTELKIDRSFVDGACEDNASRSIIESSVDLAKKLKMKTVAEGVETKEEMALVKALGCDQVQGYFVAKPMLSNDLENFMQSYCI
jgi:EAL domain-containing protein (putative c-di-GMP-specific phosphodiesterase class I)/FixJ family two-component response regulator